MAEKNYQVVNKVERTKITPAGEVIKYLRVNALSSDGTPFLLDIPEQDYDNATKLLNAKSKQIDSI